MGQSEQARKNLDKLAREYMGEEGIENNQIPLVGPDQTHDEKARLYLKETFGLTDEQIDNLDGSDQKLPPI